MSVSVTTATQLPTWAVYAVGLGTPTSAFIGVLVGNLLTRRGAKELERRSKREEVLRSLRWAAELAVSADEGKAQLGLAELQALADSDLLEAGQKLFIDAALEAVVRQPEEELEEAGEDAQAVQVGGNGLNDEADGVVSSEGRAADESSDHG
jgi:hypothetical protein